MFQTIIHPTNLSDESIPALQTAHDLALVHGSKLIVCYISQPPKVASGTTLTDPETNEVHDVAAEVQSQLPDDSEVNLETRIFIADKSTSVKKLLGFIEEMNGDLLVIGMHHRTGLASWFSSSITEDVVRHANCPVLVAKQYGVEYRFDEESAENG